ncbi:helix-turn-helix domain-containing protein [Blastococcus sp. TF02A-26]|uniref:helix-turn-helix domain-containing protein n=1 Tax=Blastococcus sp. TF02A-26 TaxID=2250577 RepID=UPI001F1D2717|nr:helix-turn-helix domain-containing protein [Blastococcus sp. TF02A-26]
MCHSRLDRSCSRCGSSSAQPFLNLTPGCGRVSADAIEQYAAGRSLREIAELMDRSFSAVRNMLDKRGVRRRGCGASPTARI